MAVVPHGGGIFGSVEAALVAFEDEPQVCVVLEGAEQRLVAANAAARAQLVDGALGQVVSAATVDELGLGDPADLEAVRRTGAPDVSSAWHVRVGEGGRTREALLHRSLLPWVDADGSVRGVVAVVSDVTATLPADRHGSGGSAGHDLVVSLSDALLPDDLPVVPGLDVAARYLLASRDAAAGGDWFDVVVRDDGRVVLVVGDVVGHGVTASAVMGQLRAVLHARLASGAPVDEAVADLDRFARSRPESRATTVVVVEVDPVEGELCYCTAGHLPPLVIDAEGVATFLPPSGGAPLGTAQPAARVASAHLRPGDLVLLHSDGLVERRGGSHSRRMAQVKEVFAHTYLGTAGQVDAGDQTRRTVERVCQQGLEVLSRLVGEDEDITVVAAQRVTSPVPISLRLPAERASIATVRQELHAWLSAVDARPLDEMSVQHAVGELVTNVVEHAYVDRSPGELRLDVHHDERGDLVAQVADDGRWLDPLPGEQGRTHGLALARGLVDSLVLDSTAIGTTVTARTRLSRPAQLLQGRAPQAHRLAASPLSFGTHPGDDRRIDVGGSLDASNADELRASARRATAGGTRPLVLDLTAVTHLGSAAVQALHEVLAEGPQPPRLQASAGSVAQQVMELVRLPHATSTDD